ncbi:hypothetical protein BH11PSE14_BH11PSE14_00650 [soil metagenome]
MQTLHARFLMTALLLAAALLDSPIAGAQAGASPPIPKSAPKAVAAAPVSGTQAAVADSPASHPLDDPDAPAPKAADPVAPVIGANAVDSVLNPGRPRRPLVRPLLAPGASPLVPLGSEVPDGPVAAPDAPVQQCAEPRATACNLDFVPVCATYNRIMACIKAPCFIAKQRSTFSSACKACRDPNVSEYVSGTCPKE